MIEPMLIGIDVGTTAVKAALFDSKGHAVRQFAESYATAHLPPNRVEQHPEDWMRLVRDALSLLSDGLAPGQVRAVGLCSHANSHVFVDSDGRPLVPAIIWQDGRAAPEARELDAEISAEEKIGWWGAPLPIDASHVLSRMAWVKRHHPEIWSATRWVLAPKDYCIYHLTGEIVADPMTSFGILDQDLQPIGRLLDLVPGARERLAPVMPVATVVGEIRAGMPCAGVPMVVGTMDAWSGLFGTGTLADGEAMYLSGTSEIIGIVSPERNPVPGVIAFPTIEGITMHAGPTQAGGASIAWLGHLLGRTPAELSALAETTDRTRRMPIFLPHLQGERAPLWNIHARASFSGIDSSMGPAEFTIAAMEGVAYSVRLLVESLEGSAGREVLLFNAAGGGMASDVWCQIRADILGKPVRRLTNLDAGVLGAAILAGTGAGQFGSIAEAAQSLVRTDCVFEPDPGYSDLYQYRFGKYLE
ncbi:MAG: hypothetical protein RLZZ444_3207, partial [Pseudomonadota bacterium]